jgi:hypothetical protein
MGLPAFKSFQIPIRWGMLLQQNVQAVLSALIGVPIVNGVLASFTASTAIPPNTDFVLNHKLGRKPQGIHPTLSSTFSSFFWLSSSTNPAPNSQVILQANTAISSGQSLGFWVY